MSQLCTFASRVDVWLTEMTIFLRALSVRVLKYYTHSKKKNPYIFAIQQGYFEGFFVSLSHDFLDTNDFMSWVGNSFKSVPNN